MALCVGRQLSLGGLAAGAVVLRVGPVREGQKGQQVPVVVDGRVVSLFHADPSLYFGSAVYV